MNVVENINNGIPSAWKLLEYLTVNNVRRTSPEIMCKSAGVEMYAACVAIMGKNLHLHDRGHTCTIKIMRALLRRAHRTRTGVVPSCSELSLAVPNAIVCWCA